jgi:hypothetical protein
MTAQDPQTDPDEKSAKAPLIAQWVKGPLYMYLTIVAAFAIIAIFVVRYVMMHGANAP